MRHTDRNDLRAHAAVPSCGPFAAATRRLWIAVLVLACLTAVGCASPLGRGWADYGTRREVEQIAADKSFPTAAEAGLAGTDETAASGG